MSQVTEKDWAARKLITKPVFKYISNTSQRYEIDLWTVHIASLFINPLLYSHNTQRPALNDLGVYDFLNHLHSLFFDLILWGA